MSCAPAHVAAVRGKFEIQQQFNWKESVKKVKKLYLERKYKLCAAFCCEVIGANPRIHPLYKTFFHFHSAVCHESLGIAVHKFSSNKIPFFEYAREAFASALETLPLPYATGESGAYTIPRIPPAVEDFESIYSLDERDPKTPTADTPTPTVRAFLPREESYISLTCSDSDSDSSATTTIPDFNDYSPRRSFLPAATTPKPSQQTGDYPTPNRGLRPKADHKARLSQSLSQDHVVDDELVPSPLFTKKPKVATIGNCPPATVSALTEAQNATGPSSRPLPALPFNHNPALALQGTRGFPHPQQRKTALSFNPFLNTAPAVSPNTPSPITPRFDMIRAAFTPIPTDHDDLRRYLAPVPLTRYNNDVAAFRTQMLAHIDSLDRRIEDAKAGWMEEQSASKVEGAAGRGVFRSRGGRVASYWSFQTPLNAQDGADEFKKRERAERISLLKSQGWPVSKERHGWRGAEYYEKLRERAEKDLEEAKC